MDAQTAHDAWLKQKLEELDAVERQIESVRPRNGLRDRALVLYLLALGIGSGVLVSTQPSVATASAFGLFMFSALATIAILSAPRHRLRALEWRRDELLAQIGKPPRFDGT